MRSEEDALHGRVVGRRGGASAALAALGFLLPLPIQRSAEKTEIPADEILGRPLSWKKAEARSGSTKTRHA